jgi:hypothetical protein
VTSPLSGYSIAELVHAGKRGNMRVHHRGFGRNKPTEIHASGLHRQTKTIERLSRDEPPPNLSRVR